MKSRGQTPTGPPGLRALPEAQNPLTFVERCMASWLDERLRTVLDEKLREWVPKAPPPTNAPSTEQPEYLSREGAALLTGYSAKTITRWIRTGRLRPYGLRGERVRRAELEQLMADLPSSRTERPETEADVARRILAGDYDPEGDE